MTDKRTFKAPFRRRKEGKTNYYQRLALIKSNKNRLVVRKTNRYVVAELVQYAVEGDKTNVFVSSRELEKYGWVASKSNISAGYLTGLLAGKKAVQSGQHEAVFDIGLQAAHHGGVIFATVKGAVDAGLKMNTGEKALPGMERISGKHVAEFAGKLSSDALNRQFSSYLKKGFDPKKMAEAFEKTKQAILAEPVLATAKNKK